MCAETCLNVSDTNVNRHMYIAVIAHYNMYQNMLKHRLSIFILILFTYYIINDIKYKYVHMYECKLTQMFFFLKLNFVHRFCHPAKSFYIRQKALIWFWEYSWINLVFFQNCLLSLLQGLRSFKNWLFQTVQLHDTKNTNLPKFI